MVSPVLHLLWDWRFWKFPKHIQDNHWGLTLFKLDLCYNNKPTPTTPQLELAFLKKDKTLEQEHEMFGNIKIISICFWDLFAWYHCLKLFEFYIRKRHKKLPFLIVQLLQYSSQIFFCGLHNFHLRNSSGIQNMRFLGNSVQLLQVDAIFISYLIDSDCCSGAR